MGIMAQHTLATPTASRHGILGLAGEPVGTHTPVDGHMLVG
jgi:hypothetical protein